MASVHATLDLVSTRRRQSPNRGILAGSRRVIERLYAASGLLNEAVQ